MKALNLTTVSLSVLSLSALFMLVQINNTAIDLSKTVKEAKQEHEFTVCVNYNKNLICKHINGFELKESMGVYVKPNMSSPSEEDIKIYTM